MTETGGHVSACPLVRGKNVWMHEPGQKFETIHQAWPRSAEVRRAIHDVHPAGADAGQVSIARTCLQQRKLLSSALRCEAAAGNDHYFRLKRAHLLTLDPY